MRDAVAGGTGSGRHTAFFCRDAGDYLRGVGGFVMDAVAVAEPVLIAVPAFRMEPLRGWLRDRLGDDLRGGPGRPPADVAFADIAEMGTNPARIIPAVRAFVDDRLLAGSGRVRCVGEPAWDTRPAAELTENARNEVAASLAFADVPVSLLCAYDATALDAATLATARRTHPAVTRDGQTRASTAYAGAGCLPPECDQPLAPPPQSAAALEYRESPGQVRRFVTEQAARAGLGRDQVTDLVIAAHELAANTLAHTPGRGTVQVWAAPGEVICQVRDSGHITDPLAGRQRPPADAAHGHGLWVVNQLCDLVELRTGPASSTIRLHMRQVAAGQAGPRVPAGAGRPRP